MELFAKDHKELADFYCRVLKFERVGESDEGTYIAIQNGGVTLGIGPQSHLSESHYFDREVLKGRKGTGIEIVLEVEDIDAYYKHVTDATYPIQTALKHRPWGQTDFRIVDPEGYFLCITSRV